MKQLALITVCLACSMAAFSQPETSLIGTWNGKIDLKTYRLSIVMNVTKDSITFDSPDQGQYGIKAEALWLTEDSVCAVVRDVNMMYKGRLADGELKGTFIQRLWAVPLTMKPGHLKRNRPQTPRPPYPYQTEEVSFANENGRAVLAGTLSIPAEKAVADARQKGRKHRGRRPKAVKEADIPVVLMVTGSGLQDRNEALFDHQPFAVLADFLARNGIASLRYDDRSFGASTGNAETATTKDLADDAEAGIEFLRKRFKRVGLIGHSEGGTIAFMLAARGKTDFIVSLAGTGIRGDSILYLQTLAAIEEQGGAEKPTLEGVRLNAERLKNAWLSYFINYDPATDIAQTKCAVLALNGEKDVQVACRENLQAIGRNLPRLTSATLKSYEGLNHLFQHCLTGSVNEYAEIEETMSEEVMNDIAKWINCLPRSKGRRR